eukprot:scaffold37683_cov255-Skeletonema_marinoi.AAC.1
MSYGQSLRNLMRLQEDANTSDDCHNDSGMQIGNCDFVNNHPVDVDDSHKIDLATSFHPRYVDICNYAESAGDNGIAVMAKHFNHCQRRFLNFFNNSTIQQFVKIKLQRRNLPNQA